MSDGYREQDIRVLEGLEGVRARPGMYIGSTGARGLHHLVYEIVDNAVDEAMAGQCDEIFVRLDEGEIITVRDNGRGIPTGLHPDVGIPTPTVVFTRLHAGGKFGGGGYHVSGGLHGVGASVVNALSTFLEVEVARDGKRFRQRFERGVPVTDLVEVGPTRQRGTTVRFQPDPEIFAETHFNAETLVGRMREMAFLNPSLTIRVQDKRRAAEDTQDAEEPDDRAAERGEEDAEDGPTARINEVLHYPGGVEEFVRYLNENYKTLHPPVCFSGTAQGIEVDVAFQYNDGYTESTNSFVNCINTAEGGQHETGFRTARTRVMNEYARRLGVWKKKTSLSGGDLREGLMAVVSLRMTDAEFEGQTKTKLGNPAARAAVEEVVGGHLAAFLDENPKVAKMLLEKSARASTARQAARRARDAARSGKSSRVRTSLDGKLTRCASRKAEDNELFIVEGDSAGGSAKQGRDRLHQAILPLKGKPLNTEKASLPKVMANKEILAIVQAIGAGIGPDFDLSRANYGRVIILADADDDGAHIRCLLLTFFYRYMGPLVRAGRVYIAQPPLFKVARKVRRKEQVRYLWTNQELDELLTKWGRRGTVVQRFKGLGEMDPTQLWETTMNPDTRTIVRVNLDDAVAAERQVNVLMGSRAEPRKQWIVRHVRFGEEETPGEGASAPGGGSVDEQGEAPS